MSVFTDTAPATSRAGSSGPSKAERRREVRYPCHDAAEIRLIQRDGSSLSATVLDISKSGLRVAVPLHLTHGAQVEVILPKQVVIFGEVRHCSRAGEEFHAGVLIEEVFYSRDLTSEHLHDSQLSLYLAGRGLTSREVLAVGQHVRMCSVCNKRLEDAKSLSETVARGRMAKR